MEDFGPLTFNARHKRSPVMVPPHVPLSKEQPQGADLGIDPAAFDFALVVGTGPDAAYEILTAMMFTDNARRVFGVAINEAGLLYRARLIASCHHEKMEHFLRLYRGRWQHDPEFGCHAQRPGHYGDRSAVDKYWHITSGAGSAFLAVRILRMLGFTRIVLAGCPMTGGDGYAIDTDKGSLDDPRLGLLPPDHTLIRGWQSNIVKMKADPDIGPFVRSMSGFTREIFGEPNAAFHKHD